MKLTKKISLQDFNNHYWYTIDLKIFAKELGIPQASKLRKDELEVLIKKFILSGRVESSKRKNIHPKGAKDIQAGLHLDQEIINYTSNKVTKTFIVNEALKINPTIKTKSGVKYRLNRWREDHINKGIKITYRDLVSEYIRLHESDIPFENIPQVRYINFLSDYLKFEKNGTRENAIKAWKEVKKMNVEKTYKEWKSKGKI